MPSALGATRKNFLEDVDTGILKPPRARNLANDYFRRGVSRRSDDLSEITDQYDHLRRGLNDTAQRSVGGLDLGRKAKEGSSAQFSRKLFDIDDYTTNQSKGQ